MSLDIYTSLCKEIDDLETTIMQIRDSIENYLKATDAFSGPSSDLKSMDYSADRVKGGTQKLSFAEALTQISNQQDILQEQLERLAKLKRIKQLFDKTYANNQSTVQARLVYLRKVKGYTQRQTAEMLGYSERQIQSIEKSLKKNEKNY